jgi:parvulin-like peptidyl-prolyl isomerase
MVRIAQILIRVGENAGGTAAKSALLQAQDLSKQIEGGANFSALAKEFSQDEVSKANGGELEWLRESQLTPQFRSAISDLKVGATTKPIKSPFGYQIIKLLERKPAGMLKMDEARATIVKSLRAARSNQIRQAYLEALTKENPIVIEDEVGGAAKSTGKPKR